MTALHTHESYINFQASLKASEAFGSTTSFSNKFSSVTSWYGKVLPNFHFPVSLNGPFVLIYMIQAEQKLSLLFPLQQLFYKLSVHFYITPFQNSNLKFSNVSQFLHALVAHVTISWSLLFKDRLLCRLQSIRTTLSSMETKSHAYDYYRVNLNPTRVTSALTVALLRLNFKYCCAAQSPSLYGWF